MDLGKINRDSEDRSVVWAAVVTAFMGIAAGLSAGIANFNGRTLDARIDLIMALVYFGLAYGVYRGSRAAAVVVVTMYVLNASVTLLVVGIGLGSLFWTAFLGSFLWYGMRGVFAQATRAPRPDPASRHPA
jgi:hypothetical protein